MLPVADSQIHTECASMSVSYSHIQFHMPCSNCSSDVTIKMKAKANLYTTAMLLLFVVQKLHIFSTIWVSRNRTPICNTVLIQNKGLTWCLSLQPALRNQAGHRRAGCLYFILHLMEISHIWLSWLLPH